VTHPAAQPLLHSDDERDLLAAGRAAQRAATPVCPAVRCPIAVDRYLDARAAGLCHEGAREIYLEALRGHHPACTEGAPGDKR